VKPKIITMATAWIQPRAISNCRLCSSAIRCVPPRRF
jgi:hypothetical protein